MFSRYIKIMGILMGFNGCISVYGRGNTVLRQEKHFATSLDPKGQGKVTRVFSYSVKI